MSDPIARPGDLFLEHDTQLFDRIIQFGERMHGGNVSSSQWNHAGIFLPDKTLGLDCPPSTVAEATAKGIIVDVFSTQGRGLTRIVPVEPLEARERVVQFALAHVGDAYGWWGIAGIVISLLTGTRLRIGKAGTYFCSGFAASGLDFASIRVQDYPEWTLPSLLDVPVFRADPLALAALRGAP